MKNITTVQTLVKFSPQAHPKRYNPTPSPPQNGQDFGMATRTAMNEHTLKRIKFDPAKAVPNTLIPMPGHGTFGVRVNKTCKSFIWVYSFHGRTRRLTLGQYPDLSLAEARAKAAQAAELHKQGSIPGRRNSSSWSNTAPVRRSKRLLSAT